LTLFLLDRLQNRSALNAKLKGTTLGAASKDDGLSAKDYVKKQKKMAKKRERELAERRQKEMEEADKASYDESECRGFIDIASSIAIYTGSTSNSDPPLVSVSGILT
jgi:hypothetical protein